jgi:hypothetical protein
LTWKVGEKNVIAFEPKKQKNKNEIKLFIF